MSGRTIAMWSGPRNISTAMMRAWENRPDTTVVDEPLYAHYLRTTGIEHPGRDAVLASQAHDWREVVERLTAPVAAGHIWYQKHMAHHITPDVELDWIDGLNNVFLVRDPDDVIRSYQQVRDDVTLEELGFPQQARLFDRLTTDGNPPPPVLDSRQVLENPRGVLVALCRHLDLGFRDEMLSWPAGPRDSDGAWAPWWYASVETSTGFGPYRPKTESLTPAQRDLSTRCRPYYEKLAAHLIQLDD